MLPPRYHPERGGPPAGCWAHAGVREPRTNRHPKMEIAAEIPWRHHNAIPARKLTAELARTPEGLRENLAGGRSSTCPFLQGPLKPNSKTGTISLPLLSLQRIPGVAGRRPSLT